MLPAHDFASFVSRVSAKRAAPADVARAGLHLVEGALRIRRGGDGLYGEVERPATKPAEAVRAWIESMAREAAPGVPFHRAAELREALVAAGEEVDAAARAVPAAGRLRGALYEDALSVIGGEGEVHPWYAHPAVPWAVAGGLLAVLLGLLLGRR